MSIKELKNNSEINETLLLLDKQLKPFRNKNGSYLEVELRDSTGKVRGRLWDSGEEVYDYLHEGEPVEVTGRVQEFMGELQVIINSIKKSDSVWQPEDFLPCLENYQEVKEEFLGKLEEIKYRASFAAEEVKILIEHLFGESFLEKFCNGAGAVKYHHPYRGGLMHHTLNVIKNAEALAKNYPEADLVLTLVGALVHDIGKIEEYNLSSGSIELSVDGILLGHIVIGNQILREKIRQIREKGMFFPQELEKLILHIITSHHAEGQWGSPRQPAILEALLVHQADFVDAEAFKFQEFTNGEEGSYSWSSLLKRNVYFKKNNWDLPF